MYKGRAFFDTGRADITEVDSFGVGTASGAAEYTMQLLEENIKKLSYTENRIFCVELGYTDDDTNSFYDAEVVVELISRSRMNRFKCQFWEGRGSMEEKIVDDIPDCGDFLSFLIKRWTVTVKNK